MKKSAYNCEIKDGETLIGALLINNMIPIPDGSFSKVDIENDRHKDYLNKEYIYIKNHGNQILNKIKNVYNDVTKRNRSNGLHYKFAIQYIRFY